MSLRNQPYFPLYVQDYLTDEKLNLCSWQTQGIYIKILCILHKQETYGQILFKQNNKQNDSKVKYFADVFVKLFPCQLTDMITAIEELIENGVLIIDEEKIYQKRMVKDGQISLTRSKIAKKGGGNPNLFKQNNKQTYKQNTEYENEYENEIKNEFEYFFNKYHEITNLKKTDKDSSFKHWKKLLKTEKEKALSNILNYFNSVDDKKYIVKARTYLSNKRFNDEFQEIKKPIKGQPTAPIIR